MFSRDAAVCASGLADVLSPAVSLYSQTVHLSLHCTRVVLESPCSGSNPSAFSTSRFLIPFSIGLVRRLSVTTVFPKNQLLSQLTFLSCPSLSVTSMFCVRVCTCVHTNAMLQTRTPACRARAASTPSTRGTGTPRTAATAQPPSALQSRNSRDADSLCSFGVIKTEAAKRRTSTR